MKRNADKGEREWLAKRWTWFAIAVVVLAFLALIVSGKHWRMFGIYHLKPYYSDMVAVLAAGEAHAQGIVLDGPNPLDPFRRPHVYGPLWLVSGNLGLTKSDAAWLGTLLWLTFAGVAGAMLAPRNPRSALVSVLILLSPPMLLGMERANNDLIIFLMIAACAGLAAASSRAALTMGAGLLVLGAGLKIYPIAALLGLAGRAGAWRKLWPWLAGSVVAGVAIAWWQWEGYRQMFEVAPRPATIFAYGVSLLFWPAKVVPGHESLAVAGLLAGVLTGGWIAWRGRHYFWHVLPLQGRTTIAAVAGGSMWLFCYLLNTNYAYRLVLLVLMIPAFMGAPVATQCGVSSVWRRLLALLALCTLWLPAPKAWLKDIFVQGGVTGEISGLGLMLLCGIEQGWMLIWGVVVAACLIGWLRRRAQQEWRL